MKELDQRVFSLPNPSGFCQCGCGNKTGLAFNNDSVRGYVKGEHVRYLPGHNGRTLNPIAKSKICTKCRKAKSLDKFNKRKASYDGHRSQCRKCDLYETAEWQKLNSERVKLYREKRKEALWANDLLRKYGLTKKEYERLILEQEGKCKLCEKTPSRLCVDHDHETGKIRGLLCINCNAGLGQLGDSAESLRKAVRYLEASEYIRSS